MSTSPQLSCAAPCSARLSSWRRVAARCPERIPNGNSLSECLSAEVERHRSTPVASFLFPYLMPPRGWFELLFEPFERFGLAFWMEPQCDMSAR